ncbi:hypothetical protein B0I03_1163, partial [Flavobacterium aquaticum]
MKINIHIKSFLVSFIFLIGSVSFSQDRCNTAVNLGTLPSAAACGSTNSGTTLTYNGTTTGATAENPYSALSCMDSPAADVWVSFVAPTNGNELNINFTSSLNTANIGLYASTGGCNSLSGVLCENSATGNITASLGALTPGTTYYMQISGEDETDFANFQLQLSVTNNCDLCVLGSNLTINPTPVGGFYLPGTTVDVCLEVTEYEQIGANWLAGVVPDFGPGWNTATLVGVSAPPGSGSYVWVYANGPAGQGWYVDVDPVGPGGPDGNLTNNYGDPSIDGTGTWTFCFRITTVNSCTPNLDLSITFDTLSDYETGGYGTAGCVGDPSFPFFAEMQCCNIPLITSVNATCLALGSATVQGQGGVTPYDYVWENSSGTVIYTNNNNAGVSSFSGLAPGVYTVTVTDNVGCVQIVDITIAGAASNTASAASSSPTICVNSLMPNITHTTTIATGIANSGISGANGLPAGVSATWSAGVITISGTPTASGTFLYNIPLTGGCGTVFATGTIVVNPSPTLTSITSITPICSGNNAVYTLTGTPNAVVTYNINGGASQTVTLNAAGTGTVTVPSVTANTTLNAISIAAAGTTVSGNASSASGGLNSANSVGVISASGAAANTVNSATIDNANNTLTLTLQHLVPAGTIITISIARDNNQGSVTISDGTANIGAFNAGPNDVLQHITVTTTVATSTIVITRVNGATWFDGVQYSFVLPGCSNTIAVSNTVVVTVPTVPTISTTAPTCAATGSSTITNYSGALTYTFTPSGPTVGAGGLISGMTVGTGYTVTAGNGSCTSVASASFTNLAMLVTPAVPTISTTAPTCIATGSSTITNY